MLRSSFPSLAPCSFPSACGGKQALVTAVLALVAAIAVGGCGSGGGSQTSATELRRVRGDGYSFDAPAAWRVVRRQGTLEARGPEGVELVRVTVFPLARPFRPALWHQAVAALDRNAAGLAVQLDGRVHERATVTVAARRARRYVIRFERDGTDVAEEFTFLLHGRREYQLVCRRDAGRQLAACGRLTSSFRPA
jgi:hypothetical protein